MENRDRDRRIRDYPPEDQYGTGGGQSYRPGRARSPPPRGDSYRAPRSPRRDNYVDSYAPGRAARARSRTPPRADSYRRSPSPRYRDRDVRERDDYRSRARSPAPRREDDLFRRPRDNREDYDRRSPPRYRDRSYPAKRPRESSLDSRGRRSPPPKRERLTSPPRDKYDEYPERRRAYSPETRERRASPPRGVTRDYRLRSRSPLARNERTDPRAVDDWRRPRSPSPPRNARQDFVQESGRNSVVSSRRSSPPVHPSRMAVQQPPMDDRTRPAPTPRDGYDTREPYRARSPVTRSPPRRRDTPPLPARDREYANGDSRVPPPREPYRNDDVPPPRAPPAGPSAHRAPSGPSAISPPSGPAAGAPMSMSAHSRAAAPIAPPTAPRGAPVSRGDFNGRGRGGYGGDYIARGRGGFSAPYRGDFRGGRGGFGGPGRAASFGTPHSYDNGPPSGPRGSFSQAPPPPPFRQGSNTTATTYPRTLRFGPDGQPIPDTPTGPRAGRATDDRRPSAPHAALADMPKIVPGGQKAASLVDRTRADKLEEEAEKLRKMIEEKQMKRRKALRDWEKLGRESELAAERSELAEQSLRNLAGEVDIGGAF